MPYLFGVDTSTILLNHESHKLHETFTVEDNTAFLLFSGDLVTSNVINGTVNGVAISQVTFSSTHAVTMGLLETELESLGAVVEATTFGAGNWKMKIVAASNAAPITEVTLVVTLGAGQVTITPTYNENRLVKGRPAIINADGTVAPAHADSLTVDIIGIAIGDAIEFEDVTINMKAFVMIFCEWKDDASIAGSVTFDAYNGTTGYNEVDDAGPPDNTNIWGWALDPGDNGDITRVALI